MALAEPLAVGSPLAKPGVLMAQTWWHGFGMLALAIVGLALVNRWFILHLFTLLYLITGSEGASRFGLFLFLYPGVFLHELSHWATAWLLGLHPSKFRVWPRATKGNLQLGSVTIRSGGPLADGLVGLAPFLVGTALLTFIGWYVFPLRRTFSVGNMAALIGDISHTPDGLLWLYIVVIVSNSMLPSASDRRPWATVAAYLVIVGGIVYALGFVPTTGDMARVGGWLEPLALSLLFSLTVDVVFVLILLALEQVALVFRGG